MRSSDADSPSSSRGIRKRLLQPQNPPSLGADGEIDLAGRAVLAYTSEDPQHPIDHLIDGRYGRGSTFWASAQADTPASIVVEFDEPQRVSRMIYEAEERSCERTQEVRVEVSSDGARTYRQVLVQEYTFSPAGATFQHEEQRFQLPPITHLRLTIVPDKHGSGTATLNSLRLFS